jgi:hypothetical protein
MSEKKLVEYDFSKEAGVDLEFKDGKLRLVVSYDGTGADAGLYVDLEPDYFLDKLKEIIPGQVDDMIIEALKGALK